MGSVPRLFNRTIASRGRLSQAEQVRDILCEEIHAGRWEIGERLPSVASLSAMTGMGRKTIQTAFDALKAEGYIRSEDRRGTFLLSLLPRGAKPTGAVGVLLEKDQPESDIVAWRLNSIIEAVIQRNYLTEIKHLDADDDWQTADIPGRLFSDRVVSIVSLKAFPRPLAAEAGESRIPLVFLAGCHDDCAPLVTTDMRRTYYDLTRHVLAQGHRRVAFCTDPALDAIQTRVRIEGYEKAMAEAGALVDRRPIDWSQSFENDDLSAFGTYLERLTEHSTSGCEPVGATAVVCGALNRAATLVSVADMLGVRVPADLSVVSMGTQPIRGSTSGQKLTGCVQDTERQLDICFDLLAEEARRGHYRQSVTLTMPDFVIGDTLAPPAEALRETESRLAAVGE